MGKYKFSAEFEIKASKKMLFPYLSTPNGLAQWYADKVSLDDEKCWHFKWNNDIYKAKMTIHKTNQLVKFEFVDEGKVDPAFVEFKLDHNELTDSVFLKVIDYSDTGDDEEMYSLWSGMVNTLREIVGG